MDRVEKLKRIAENQSLIYNSGYMSGMSKSVGGIQFTSDLSEILIRYSSNGTVKFYANDNLIEQVDTNAGLASIVLPASQDRDNSYRIEGIENLLTLDVSNQGVGTFFVNSYTSLTKLVIYDNNIIKLDLSNCPELRYLHFHNNPICDEDVYEANLIECVRSLPDRTGKVLGSIVMYPWYGLETLICNDNGVYRKYPIGKWKDVNDIEVGSRNFYNNSVTVNFVSGKLYGVVDENNAITYFTGTDSGLLEHTAMNRHHLLRKRFESDITLKKNWMFGSAIQYVSEEYKYCHYYFRNIGVQDVWETAEKGFGICIGSIDQFPGKALGWENMNVVANINATGANIVPYDVLGKSWAHGDFILSQIVGRGDNVCYGICPNASIFVVDWSGASSDAVLYGRQWRDCIKRITKNCNSYTSSYNVGSSNTHTDVVSAWAETRLALGKFGKDNIITASAGNDGDGQPWTTEIQRTKTIAYGNFGTDDDILSIENPPNTFYVPSLSPSRQASVFSNSTVDSMTNIPTLGDVYKLPLRDYISSYGEQILGYDNNNGQIECNQGTSMSSPNCNATLALMRCIYSKINPECNSFGKGSEFMEYVINNWVDSIPNQMDFSVGIGIPCFNASPLPRNVALPDDCGLIHSVSHKVGEVSRVIDLPHEDCKSGVTFHNDFKYTAKYDSSRVIPIRPGNSNAIVYSNSSVSSPSDYKSNYYVQEINFDDVQPADTYELIRDGRVASAISDVPYKGASYKCVVPLEDSDEYTAHIVIKFDADKLFDTNVAGIRQAVIPVAFLLDDYDAGSALAISNISCEVTEDDSGALSSRIVFKAYDANKGEYTSPTVLSFARNTSPGSMCSPLASYNILNISEGDIAIITVVSDGEYFKVYYNGNLLNIVSRGVLDIATLDSLSVLVDPLMTEAESANDVVFYSRALTHSEVINNTIALIQEKEAGSYEVL